MPRVVADVQKSQNRVEEMNNYSFRFCNTNVTKTSHTKFRKSSNTSMYQCFTGASKEVLNDE